MLTEEDIDKLTEDELIEMILNSSLFTEDEKYNFKMNIGYYDHSRNEIKIGTSKIAEKFDEIRKLFAIIHDKYINSDNYKKYKEGKEKYYIKMEQYHEDLLKYKNDPNMSCIPPSPTYEQVLRWSSEHKEYLINISLLKSQYGIPQECEFPNEWYNNEGK